jgi:hypothetical protein
MRWGTVVAVGIASALAAVLLRPAAAQWLPPDPVFTPFPRRTEAPTVPPWEPPVDPTATPRATPRPPSSPTPSPTWTDATPTPAPSSVPTAGPTPTTPDPLTGATWQCVIQYDGFDGTRKSIVYPCNSKVGVASVVIPPK